MPKTDSSRTSLISQNSIDTIDLSGNHSTPSLVQLPEDSAIQGGQQQAANHPQSHRIDRASEKLLSQVADWLQREKIKRETKKPRKHHHHHHHLRRKLKKSRPEEATAGEEVENEDEDSLRRTASNESNSSDVSLDRLQRILDDSMAALGLNSVSHYNAKLGRRSSHRKKLASRSSQYLNRAAASSDTDFVDGDVLVPSCDAVLDNSKTLKYSQAGPDDSVSVSSKREEKERQAWITFKNEIIRLAHTLRLKGWRRVPLDSGDEIQVERLSGALTNAVYVVTPPENLPESEVSKKKPTKVLLRIYGPHVEQLIDRDNELSILKRLARKKIGPRLLGTFKNGRFEQFFNAAPLTPEALREPDTSKQIAKRMRELHEGIDLLEDEKDEGPTVFRNWDNWVDNVERRSLFLDQVAASHDPNAPVGPADAWKKCGFVCGLEWPKFKAMVDKYREFLIQYYGPAKLREKLVFAHNDTQYGNILRVQPDDEKSPLMHPENEHKQLIVIDFEYASANTPGLEFANHFTEWSYNYHDLSTSHACNAEGYPSPEEQKRFLKAYVNHRPKFATSSSSANSDYDVTPGATPLLAPQNPSSSIVEFMLDARVPPGGWKEEERRAAEASDEKVRELMEETRVWRAMNSAQWVAWGIVQAKIPGYSEAAPDGEGGAGNDVPVSPVSSVGTVTGADLGAEGGDGSAAGGRGADEEAGFDYLSYAHERALFFWGDCVQMGLVRLQDLPERLRGRVKIVDY